jgi:hypothetical protein
VVYAAFLGVMLCAAAFLTGLVVLKRWAGAAGVLGGIAAIVLSTALGVAFAALLMRVRWAVSVCRATAPPMLGVAAICLIWGVLVAVRSVTPDAGTWEQALDVLTNERLLAAMLGTAVAVLTVAFLFGSTAKRYFAG